VSEHVSDAPPETSAAPRFIGPVEAIQRGFRGYVRFTGRATRAEFWWWTLVVSVASVVAGRIDTVTRVPVLGTVVFLGTLLPSIAVTMRRLHDRSKSGAFMLLVFVPLVGVIILLWLCCLPSTPGPNQYDSPTRGSS
jgi:uncharacterized membrane protein YhaH (DUF805 family)